MKFTCVIPERIDQLLRDGRGWPIPFFVAYENGQPNFKLADIQKVIACAKEQVCWICGKRLGVHASFIGGPMSCENQVFSDGPMHRDCAEFALKVCPYLALPTERQTLDGIAHPDAVMEKPVKFGHLQTKHWSAQVHQGHILFTAGPIEKLTWWKDGKEAV